MNVPPRSLVRWLAALCGSLVALGLLAGVGSIYLTWTAQRALLERQLHSSALAAALSLDRELGAGLLKVEALTYDLPLDAEAASEALFLRAQRMLDSSSGLRTFTLNSAYGEQRWNTRIPRGSKVPIVQYRHERQAIDQGRGLITDLYEGRSSAALIASYVVPVQLGGNPHVLVASLDLTHLGSLLGQGDLPDGAVVSLIDRNLRFLARSVRHDRWVGQFPSNRWMALVKASPKSGVGEVTTREGIDTYTAWASLPMAGWTIGLAVPKPVWQAPIWKGVKLHVGLVASIGLVASLLAWFAARVILSDTRRLAAQARQVAEEQPTIVVPAQVREFAEIDRSLVAAAERLADRRAAASAAAAERQLALELERDARQAAERANRFKDEFLVVLAHEMRNPLAAIASAGGVLRSLPAPSPQTGQVADVLDRQSHQLQHLVDELTDVGRLLTRTPEMHLERLDLSDRVDGVLRMLDLSGVLPASRIERQVERAWVMGNPRRLDQAISNLLTNAARYAPGASPVRVELRASAGRAEFTVVDQGRGLAPDDLERIFGLFVQAGARGDVASRQSGDGLGVGLAVVRRIAELHGGGVVAESAGLGAGATFRLWVPSIDAERLS